MNDKRDVKNLLAQGHRTILIDPDPGNARAVTAQHAGSMGDTSDAGAIRIPESLWGDVAHDRLLVSEEDTATGTAVRLK